MNFAFNLFTNKHIIWSSLRLSVWQVSIILLFYLSMSLHIIFISILLERNYIDSCASIDLYYFAHLARMTIEQIASVHFWTLYRSCAYTRKLMKYDKNKKERSRKTDNYDENINYLLRSRGNTRKKHTKRGTSMHDNVYCNPLLYDFIKISFGAVKYRAVNASSIWKLYFFSYWSSLCQKKKCQILLRCYISQRKFPIAIWK